MRNSATTPPKKDVAILLIGDPGARKTTLALHAPKPYIFDMDHNSVAPGKQVNRPYKFDFANVDDEDKPVPPRERYAHMVKCLNAAATDPEISTIILDSFTSLTDILIEECRRQDPKISNPLTPLRIQDWGTFAYLFKHIITTMRESSKHLICCAHQKIERDETQSNDRETKWKFMLHVPGQAATNISGLFTDVLNPYPEITGRGSAINHNWKVRCLPASEDDHRGLKSSFGFSKSEPYTKVAEVLSNL